MLWPVLLNTIDGVAAVDPTMRETARGVPDQPRAADTPRDAAGRGPEDLRRSAGVSLSLSLVLMVVSELVGGTDNGIGSQLLVANNEEFDFANMWAGIVLLGVIGYALNTVSARLRKPGHLAWQPKQERTPATVED